MSSDFDPTISLGDGEFNTCANKLVEINATGVHASSMSVSLFPDVKTWRISKRWFMPRRVIRGPSDECTAAVETNW
jgi:hypothetical protein